MPELAEVETVKEVLKKQVLNKKISEVKIIYPSIIETNLVDFKTNIKNQTIIDIKRRGKWLLFELNNYILLSHLRMEGKYFYKKSSDELQKHDHIIFIFTDDTELRYHDVRKFGRMALITKDDLENNKHIKELGLEPWDSKLTINYLKDKYKKKKLAIKTILLDQSIISGIGNIYANEILFASKINPSKVTNTLSNKELKAIIENTKIILDKAIKDGGTTIKSYTSSEGVLGGYQNKLLVHGKEKEACSICRAPILKSKINGRGTYYCQNCQK